MKFYQHHIRVCFLPLILAFLVCRFFFFFLRLVIFTSLIDSMKLKDTYSLEGKL